MQVCITMRIYIYIYTYTYNKYTYTHKYEYIGLINVRQDYLGAFYESLPEQGEEEITCYHDLSIYM